MSDETKAIFDKLKDDVTHCHGYWNLYCQVFATNENRINIINSTNPRFFIMFQKLIIDFITLELSKYTDPAESGKFKNLSPSHLLELLKTKIEKPLYDKLSCILKRLKESTLVFRYRRNKQVAHKDLLTFQQNDEYSLSQKNIEDALLLVREFLNEIDQYFNDSVTDYQKTIGLDDGTDLIVNLAKSLAYDDLVKQQKIPYQLWESYGEVF
jgi:hypothetical protein